tara:strand:- start:811 stop:1893 length:1083 start_codon:yes stop_codon:yes gene_type:complete
MASILDYITEGTRHLFVSLKNRISPKKYDGNAKSICQEIVKDCWNGRFFQTSTTNFTQFWARDFGWCVGSLIKLKYEKEVQQTVRYALNRYKHYNKVTTTITPGGKPFDFPVPAVDSLPWLIHAVKASKVSYHSFKPFLNREIQKFYDYFIDENTGLVKPHLHVSSMKDFTVRKSSCYDNCMVALLAKNLKGMKLNNPFTKFNYPQMIKKHFWNGHYFYDDLAKKHYVAGDANIFPFVLGIIGEKEMMKSAVKQIQAAKLDEPWPLKYTQDRRNIEFIWQEKLMRNYESDSIWMHMGPLYVKLVQQVDRGLASKYKKKYKEVIEKHQNFLEVFNTNGKPFSSFPYYTSSGMLWAANYLTL